MRHDRLAILREQALEPEVRVLDIFRFETESLLERAAEELHALVLHDEYRVGGMLDERAVLDLGLLEGSRTRADLLLQRGVEPLQLFLERGRLLGLLGDTIHHSVECSRELGQLARSADRDAVGRVSVGQRFGTVGEFSQRRRDASCQKTADRHSRETQQDAGDDHPQRQAPQFCVLGIVAEPHADVAPGLLGALDEHRDDRLERRLGLPRRSGQVHLSSLRPVQFLG